MAIRRNRVDSSKFNPDIHFPYELRIEDISLAMQDVYDFFFDINAHVLSKGLDCMDDMVRSAIMSGLLSDMLTASVAKHSRTLTVNRYFNGHPDLVVRGIYANDSAKAGTDGVEIKTTRKASIDRRGRGGLFNIRADQFGGCTNRPVCAKAEVASRHLTDGRSHPALTKAGNACFRGACEGLIRKIFRFVTYFFQSPPALALIQST